ncbi:ribosomal protein S18 acetylase RimI-like enzyme [Trueperella bonasi]|uniref:Ribosomal protein S18 acetylase RimI-like enzyme n=1 Tax=Trueperella bonasi TaxID=312286 RepID=A0ABT9NEN4_9ACTO|nr:GNAT family N-acetyltransferase [Trueperella bonasi]MDP9805837.1 ribosomal protein S18 acetylase RimI-like enzyme [Trueperella bonasi]
MPVERVTRATPELVDAFNRLIPQLSSTAPEMTLERLEEFLSLYSTNQFIFRGADGDILGLAMLVCFEIPTGRRGRVEDVIVDESARGQGAGRALIYAVVERAKELGVKSLELQSHPTREPANALYRGTGFYVREINLYRHEDIGQIKR